jgi:hypothetical protein
MTSFAIIAFAALTVPGTLTVSGPALSLGNHPAECGTKPNSYVPGPHTDRHVYGTPIQPAVAGHAKYSHRKHAPKKRSSR